MKFLKILIYLLFFLKISPKDYKILVLPSGGATGIVSACLLQDIEKQTKVQICNIFDEIWACSAGAIITSLISSTKSNYKNADLVVKFFEQNFSNYYKSYFIRESVSKEIGNCLIKETSIPIRILTAACKDESLNIFKPHDFSSDGFGVCKDNNILLKDIIKASCTVYPYLYRTPTTITINKKEKLFCIDAGCICCKDPIIEPTSYFLKQFLSRLTQDDTLTIIFLCNAFTQSIDYDEISEILKHNNKSFSYEIIYCDNGNFNFELRKKIAIINIPFLVESDDIINNYLKSTNIINKVKIITVRLILEKILGKENAAPNMLGMGIIPLYVLKNEAQKIIQNSKNYKSILEFLKNKN